ncbi:efflux RND transporter periplasmic adaptor subunit [Anaeromyxobacter oryzisoli]|uniref:efflux RND transporter periplasmic adaptor subunit n=1 Tax=Anaeromyxobacter oryzisoli TaxID=2925408 RepID=UPI001F59637A|nr:efflux RND transporter periplasmic adaptor subunit [Anaeromyxobacter sp. SG63]
MKRSALILAVALASSAAGVVAGVTLLRPRGPPVAGPRKPLYYRAPMNPARTSPVPRKDEMGMDYVPVYEGTAAPPAGATERGVYVEPRMAQSSGVRDEVVRSRPLARVIRTVGQVTYDERRLYNLNAKIAGWITRLYVDYTGKPVRRGDPLMSIYSPELYSTEEEYLLALRHRGALAASSSVELRAQADALVRSARQRLRYFDVPDSEIRALERRGFSSKALTLRSPADGYVVEKAVVAGAHVTPGMPLFRIADLSTVWVLADVYEYELPWVAVGQRASVTLPYAPGPSLEGRVTFVYPTLAGETRTVKVRVELRDPGRRVQLKPDMFATVIIRSPIVREAVAVPEQAVIRTGERAVGIVSLGGGWFEPRELKLGVAADGWVEILEGVRAGERIVTSSQFLIDSESNLRAAVAAMTGDQAGGAAGPSPAPAPQPGVQGRHGGPGPHRAGAAAGSDHAGHGTE